MSPSTRNAGFVHGPECETLAAKLEGLKGLLRRKVQSCEIKDGRCQWHSHREGKPCWHQEARAALGEGR